MEDLLQEFPNLGGVVICSASSKCTVSQHALLRACEARHTGALSKGGKMRGVATNVYLWKSLEKPKETGQNENSKFGSCIYA